MNERILDWLLEEENPSVRYAALTTLCGCSAEDPEVKSARNAIMEHGVVPNILQRQNADGSWGNPERFYDDKYEGSSWTLLILAELGADGADKRVKDACEFILQHSYHSESGSFSHSYSMKTQSGLSGGIIPCLTGNMVFALIQFGYLEDERIQKAIDWICRYQRTDDGDPRPPVDPFIARFSSCWGLHSCHMGVAKALKALAAIPQKNRSEAVTAKIKQLSEYFLMHHLYKKSHDLFSISKPGWLKFGFPLMYQTDVLELLGIFADLQINDPRLDDAIAVVESKRSDSGTWLMENSYNGKTLVSIEHKGKPSKWITLKAMKTLKNIHVGSKHFYT